jgi:hypothetical protein
MKTKTEKKKMIVILVMMFVTLFGMQLASAEFWGCFEKGEIIDYCNPAVTDRTCGSDVGCLYCMNDYEEDNNCYNQGNHNVCNGITPDCEEIDIGEGPEIDISPPELLLFSPVEGGIYTSRSVLIDFDLSEKADVYYYDHLDGRDRWNRICRGCFDYSRKRSFSEGLNDLTFRAIDVLGNEMTQDVSFYVDSREPRISRTEPRRGFASGMFNVQFREDNPEYLYLYYGVEGADLRLAEVDMGSECVSGRRGYDCSTNVDLDDYDGEEMVYWFELEDLAGSVDNSRKVYLDVDTTFPDYTLEYTQDGRNVVFILEIKEDNFDEAVYEVNSDSRPRERRLCSRLRDGVCEKKVRFSEGTHQIDIRVIDDAGNAVGESIEITV